MYKANQSKGHKIKKMPMAPESQTKPKPKPTD